MSLLAFKKIFKQPLYLFIGVVVAFTVFLASVFMPNFKLIRIILFSDTAISQKIKFLLSLVEGLGTSITSLSAMIIIIMSILFGINVAMLTYLMRKNIANKKIRKEGGFFTSLGGLAGGVLGIGCAACGSLLLTPLFAFFGGTAFLAALPAHGAEFGLIGVALLAFSIYIIAKKVNDPKVCPVE